MQTFTTLYILSHCIQHFTNLRMSGVEVVGLISAIIGIIDTSIKIYNAFKSASGLPSSLHDVASRLPLIQETLQIAKDGMVNVQSELSLKNMTSCLESCQQKAEKIKLIFSNLAVLNNSARIFRLYNAWRATTKAEKVATLSKEISEHLQVLTANHAIQAATRSQMDEVIAKLDPGRANSRGVSVSFSNWGSGRVITHSGVGDQKISGGSQISGVFEGPVNFSSSFTKALN